LAYVETHTRQVLEGQQVLPTRALEEGYKFKYGTVGAAVSAITKGQ
jgi:NAD dependent epimerase/dehydratase family enzyme